MNGSCDLTITLQQNEKWTTEEWESRAYNNVLGIINLTDYRVVEEGSWMDKMKKMIPFSSLSV